MPKRKRSCQIWMGHQQPQSTLVSPRSHLWEGMQRGPMNGEVEKARLCLAHEFHSVRPSSGFCIPARMGWASGPPLGAAPVVPQDGARLLSLEHLRSSHGGSSRMVLGYGGPGCSLSLKESTSGRRSRPDMSLWGWSLGTGPAQPDLLPYPWDRKNQWQPVPEQPAQVHHHSWVPPVLTHSERKTRRPELQDQDISLGRLKEGLKVKNFRTAVPKDFNTLKLF